MIRNVMVNIPISPLKTPASCALPHSCCDLKAKASLSSLEMSCMPAAMCNDDSKKENDSICFIAYLSRRITTQIFRCDPHWYLRIAVSESRP